MNLKRILEVSNIKKNKIIEFGKFIKSTPLSMIKNLEFCHINTINKRILEILKLTFSLGLSKFNKNVSNQSFPITL